MNLSPQTKFEAQLGKLYQRINYERQSKAVPKTFDLRKMTGLVERLDSPQRKYPVIHVAGTKGKGSVCAMLGSVLTAAGLKTGVYTSPHLETIHQRMQVDGQMVSDDQMLEVFDQFEPIVAEYDKWLESQNRRTVTFFEFTTAMAMQFFANQKCDAVILETGLGGRLDSTNVCQPELCIITNISLDHTKQLGSRLEKIAFEKAGIIKPDVPVINGVVGAPCEAVVAEVARDRNSPLTQRGRDFTFEYFSDKESFDFVTTTDGDEVRLENLKTGMLGRHQSENASLVVAAARHLRQSGWDVGDDAIRTGLQNAHLAGRMEQVNSSPAVILDMAHNEASVAALSRFLQNDSAAWKSADDKTLIFATTKEKDYTKMLAELLPLFDRVVFTQYQNNPRAMPLELLVEVSEQLGFGDRVSCLPTPVGSWSSVFSAAKETSFICVAGSAFLLAELRMRVIADCEDRNK